jgi:hypothetical protein
MAHKGEGKGKPKKHPDHSKRERKKQERKAKWQRIRKILRDADREAKRNRRDRY